MNTVVTPELCDEANAAAIDAALALLDAPADAKEIGPKERRRLRELIKPQANGDQDSW